jgi:TatD DNase family protein
MDSLQLFDTHTHMYLAEFDSDRTAAMERALEAGVQQMMLPNVDLSTIEPMKSLHAAYPESTFMAMGLHPTEVNAEWQTALDTIEREFRSGADYRAVGEVGIDLYWDETFAAEQATVFEAQLTWADEVGLPVIIHCREALSEVLKVIDARSGRLPQLIFHSFGGSVDDIAAIRRRTDAYFGINGIVTFKNSRLREVVPSIGIDRLLLETDAPYLAPVPHRGHRNESAYIVDTAAAVATALGTSLEHVAATTTANAATLFL